MGGDALQIAAVHTAMAAMAYLSNIMIGLLNPREAYPGGWRAAGTGVTAWGPDPQADGDDCRLEAGALRRSRRSESSGQPGERGDGEVAENASMIAVVRGRGVPRASDVVGSTYGNGNRHQAPTLASNARVPFVTTIFPIATPAISDILEGID